jgi:outer membrane protein OmpA-like peptidoglycan-associated protein
MNRNREQLRRMADRSAPVGSPIGDESRSQADSAATLISRQLPDGSALRIPRGAFEDRLVMFIADPSRPVDPNLWFDFDRLTFETGSATLRPDSREQLTNAGNILKAYPHTRVKICGYTDNTDDPSADQKLSQARADRVKQELNLIGISNDRIVAEGYGAQHPVADNSTEEGRATNRRISMSVTQK